MTAGSDAASEALSPRTRASSGTTRPTRPDAAALAHEFRLVRARTLRLAAPLGAEDCCAQSMPDASPTKWHLAHTTWFFETFVLERADRRFRPFSPLHRVLFNSYYNGIGEQHPRPRRGLLTRPSLDEVRDYRVHVDRETEALLARGASADLLALIELGLQHEQQHQELILTDVKHLLAQNPLRPVYRGDLAPVPARRPPPLRWHRHEEGLRSIGTDGPGFHFDNEGPRHSAFVAAFELASRAVTNAEFLAFVEAGGYARPEWWLADGWAAVQAEGWTAPAYWERDGHGGWREFTLGGPRALAPDSPVSHVSYYEADAFARFAGARLPTEAEWEHAAASAGTAGNFVEQDVLHPAPAAPAGAGPAQLFGDVWEWTQSAYAAYPGFRPAAGAIGEYNGKFMCNQFVLRGGSCATPAGHVRRTYRNFFPPASRWQFSGIRLARDPR